MIRVRVRTDEHEEITAFAKLAGAGFDMGSHDGVAGGHKRLTLAGQYTG